ncbi:NepR family anti-sigma factor [Microvirga aerophila]|nr:NepR family anti-sigma factor [Microvirga aerophila]
MMNDDRHGLPQDIQTSPQASDPKVAPEIKDAIGQGLRAMYESLKAEPLPDRLVQLLKQLDTQDQDKAS